MENKAFDHKQFIQKYFVEEVERMQASGFQYYSFVLIAQIIEAMGGFLDNKPLRAKGQSKKRFGRAIKALFSHPYRKANIDDWLYFHFRCNMSHLFLPSGRLYLVSQEQAEERGMTHLSQKDGRLVLVAEDFSADLRLACEKLLEKVDKGTVDLKPLEVGWDGVS